MLLAPLLSNQVVIFGTSFAPRDPVTFVNTPPIVESKVATQKKKCDEGRPICARCKETGQECVYGPLRPRQRRSAEGSSASFQQGGAADAPSLPQPALGDDWLDADFLDLNWLGADFLGDELAAAAEECDRASLGRPPSPSPPPSSAVARRHYAGAFYATPHLELNMPLFSEFTTIRGRRVLLDHFANTLSHLIVLREDGGSNPFQQLVLPMSRRSPAVASAIYALSSAHLEFRGASGGEKSSIEFHSEAARNLANLIERGAEGNQNELLAAVILLIYYEVLVHRERSQIVNGHLKGAMAILNLGPAPSDPTRAFLERAFRFYDVIAALSFRTPTLSSLLAPGNTDRFLPVDSRGTSQPAGSADALLGMATSLWPIVHQLSNLGALKDQVLQAESDHDTVKSEQLRAELESTASTIEASLIAWEPELSPDQAGTLQAGTSSAGGAIAGILDNARAYQHSSLVHLHRSILGARREDATVQAHVRASLRFCVGTVESAGPMGALLWPLFVAACEARLTSDRALAEQAFASIDKHQGMANIGQSWRIVREVWRRADERAANDGQGDEGEPAPRNGDDDGEGGVAELGIDLQKSSLEGFMRGPEFGEEDLWRKVCRDMELSVVFG
ncbi:hypothetical protein ISF_03100 [Cordyceps fumosorosea ARSEF 2679]|uniref:Zn(2)-C6 fungal-type domain-containing protein n=1 Tax=Cordyceps fumosorosea (strain ARSEF 2679) TaxID=1081104 RepID=A0A168BA09_CORFA|nr:hypothetical protein ISF_03100 [Cordyceps fumosorosea ARSEF 2679]OAA69830.1 hypothetical protein ISF_03100 [Cordyceps fumosorosea ARSEF 2679]